VKCLHPECTGVHDNNRWSELCPRSRAAKRIKDSRYIHNGTVTEGLATKGFTIRQHRERMAFIRRCVRRYGSDSSYAELFGTDPKEIAYWEGSLAKEMKRFRAARGGHRGTRRKIDIICTGRTGVISVAEVLNYTRRPEIRTWFWL
jgi:hypothetical protein